jgi:hypothetical protein
MESNHFDDAINGCIGGQFAPPPPFALWTLLPCLRSPYIAWILRIPTLILVTMSVAVALGSLLLGVACSILFLPITLPLFGCLSACDLLNESGFETLLISPGYLVCGLIGSIFFLILELIWLPVPTILSIILFPFFLLTQDSTDPDRPSLCSYFSCMVEGEISPFWCYPVAVVVNGISALLTCFDDDD